MHAALLARAAAGPTSCRATIPELFRHLVPCDPVVTVAPDVRLLRVLLQGRVELRLPARRPRRLRARAGRGLGTTNVDYSLALYDHFQTLRSYRATRLLVDPTGFEVKVEGRARLPRGEDRPAAVVAARLRPAPGGDGAALPARGRSASRRSTRSSRTCKRHREKTGPRSIRFQLTPGKPPSAECSSRGASPSPAAATGLSTASARRRSRSGAAGGCWRWRACCRSPSSVEVRLLGSGLPSIWIAHLGEMRFVLALSGWTANDWTSSAALELMAAAYPLDAGHGAAESLLAERRRPRSPAVQADRRPREAAARLAAPARQAGPGDLRLRRRGYRWRQVMPGALSRDRRRAGTARADARPRALHRERKVRIQREEALAGGRRMIVARPRRPVRGILDTDGGYSRAKCSCSYFYKNRLRAGPCRHLLALQLSLKDAVRLAVAPAAARIDARAPAFSQESSPARRSTRRARSCCGVTPRRRLLHHASPRPMFFWAPRPTGVSTKTTCRFPNVRRPVPSVIGRGPRSEVGRWGFLAGLDSQTFVQARPLMGLWDSSSGSSAAARRRPRRHQRRSSAASKRRSARGSPTSVSSPTATSPRPCSRTPSPHNIAVPWR